MSSEEIVGIFAGLLLIIGILPQVYKILKTRQAKDISLIAYTILGISQILWVVYGVLKNDLRIILTNSITLFLSIIIMMLVVYFKDEKEKNREMHTSNINF